MNEPEQIIISIPHTGTRFLQERLGIEAQAHHTTGNWTSLRRRVEGKQIISPLRAPPDVWKSWARRHEFKSHSGEPFPYARFFSAWYVMHTLDMLFYVDFICVDKREDPRIKDWERIGHHDTGCEGLPVIDLRPLYFLPFVKKHYRSPRK